MPQTPDPLWKLIAPPESMEEARIMLAAAISKAVGDADDVDMAIRVAVKGVSARTVAGENNVHRDTVGRVVRRLKGVERAMAEAVERGSGRRGGEGGDGGQDANVGDGQRQAIPSKISRSPPEVMLVSALEIVCKIWFDLSVASLCAFANFMGSPVAGCSSIHF